MDTTIHSDSTVVLAEEEEEEVGLLQSNCAIAFLHTLAFHVFALFRKILANRPKSEILRQNNISSIFL